MLGYQFFYRRELPHLQPAGATLFITFRLVGSIPAEIQQQYLEEIRRTEAFLAGIRDPQARAQRVDEENRRFFGRWDKVLDSQTTGPFWLRDYQVGGIVADSLHFLDSRMYTLDAFCIMPNHVHLVCTPLIKADGTYHAMPAILHSLKRHTARQANLYLKRAGAFWQHESYDHVVRDEAERNRIVRYVVYNPVKAGLVERPEDWPWSYSRIDAGQTL
ncbi:MAG: transposase [Chloroflexi bacterium]|nr:transposase [Chloroflexota bacterium]